MKDFVFSGLEEYEPDKRIDDFTKCNTMNE
jgi:hypothetical protein